MKFYKHLTHYLNAALLILPAQLLAADEKTAVLSKTSSSLSSNTFSANPLNGSYMAQLVIGLFIVLFCIVVLAWLAKKMNRFHSPVDGSLKIIGGLSMGSREKIVLLQVGKEQLLLGISPGRINTLHVLDSPLEKKGKQTDASGNSFFDRLKTTIADANNVSETTANK